MKEEEISVGRKLKHQSLVLEIGSERMNKDRACVLPLGKWSLANGTSTNGVHEFPDKQQAGLS